MKPQLFILTLLVTALLVPGPAVAQAPQPPAGDTTNVPAPWIDRAWDESQPLPNRPKGEASPAAPASPAVPIGPAGLSFRYMQTLGTTEVPYLADTTHLNYPWGLGVAGNAVWIGEFWGGRALKFTNDGTFVSSIGQAESRDYEGYYIGEIADVTVDSASNTWLSNSSQALKFDSSGAYVSTLGEGWGTDNEHFQYVVSIAFDSVGNIYVSDGTTWWGGSDPGNHRIQIFSSSGAYLNTIGMTGSAGTANNRFHGPRHIAIYGNTLYVADSGNHRVQLFDVSNPLSPTYVATIGVAGQSGSDNSHLGSPSSVAADTSYIYVADTWNSRVQIFNRATRAYVATIGGTQGAGNYQFFGPSDVAVDAAGNIYVADFVNTRVQQFNSSRTYMRTYGTTGVPYLTDGYHYNSPSGVAAAADGSLYITEDSGHRLIKLNAAGQLEWTVGAAGVKGDWNHANDRLNNPADVALDASGRVLVADRWNGRLQIFNADGSYYATLSQAGSDQRGFNCPGGVGVAPNGDIYVANTCSHVVDIFDRHWRYQATLGTVDQAGTDNAHFDKPEDVAVDSRGFIYVTDKNNQRVQVFDVNRAYVRTIGVTGEDGRDFSHLGGPDGLFVDGTDRLYVADSWNNRIQVFDANGAYLTTIGGSWGVRTGQFKGPSGVAVDPNGDVLVVDTNNHRVQKFSPGVPGWVQTNVNGFGDRTNGNIHTLTPFAGKLYAGTYNSASYGAQLWTMDTANNWTPAITAGFGITRNIGINHLVVFGNQLYAGVRNDQAGASVYRTSDGSHWNPVVTAGFGDPANTGVYQLAEFNGQLYAGTSSWTAGHGGEIWRSPSGNNGTWQRVVSGGFDNPNNHIMRSSEVHNGYLYFGTENVDTSTYGSTTGGIIIRTSAGGSGSWSKVTLDGLGDVNNFAISGLASFNGFLYASTARWDTSGIQVWRCQSCDSPGSWQNVVNDGFGDPYNWGLSTLHVFNGSLYLVIGNGRTGIEVWRTSTGNSGDWIRVSAGGFGDSNNSSPYYNNVTTFNSRLYIGTQNNANGPEIWQKTVTAGFTGTPTNGRPPLAVSFTNASAGDFTSNLWDFGDGQTSTASDPTHTYAQAGAYTVSLTVSDGVDSNTLTRPAYVNAWYRFYLPLSFQGYDPTIYDRFDNPAYDGAFNPLLWSPSNNDMLVQFRQQSGALVVTNTPSANPTGESLMVNRPRFRRWQQVQRIQARLKVSSDRSGNWSPVGIVTYADEINGHTWFASCTLGGSANSSQASFSCGIFIHQGNSYPSEYWTPEVLVDYGSWHTARIETDPYTANVRFYLDNTLIGSHTPTDAAALVGNDQLQVAITVWGAEANSSATRYVDDVRITPAQ